MTKPRGSEENAKCIKPTLSNRSNSPANKAQVEEATGPTGSTVVSKSPDVERPKLQTSRGMKADVATAGETPTSTCTTMAEAPSTKARILPKSTLYRFAPEIRKEVFKAVLALFFQEFPELKGIIYEVCPTGAPLLNPDTAEKSHLDLLIIPDSRYRVYAGQYQRLLPALELALFVDPMLHEEFITTRIEESSLTLKANVIADPKLGPDFVVWPRVNAVPRQVRTFIRSVTYVLDVNETIDERLHMFLGGAPPSDSWDRMHQLARALKKSLYKSLVSYYTQDSEGASMQPKSPCVLLPLLNNITIRFQDASREGRGQSFMMFEEDRNKFFRRLCTIIRDARIKSFQLEDLRDFKVTGAASRRDRMEPLGLMNKTGPRFGKFTTDLDKAFGVKHEDHTEIDHEDIKGRGEGWEIYKAKETWTATGDYLIWK